MLGLYLNVERLDDATITYHVDEMPDDCCVALLLSRRVSARRSQEILRELARAIEANPELLTEPEDAMGTIRDGVAIASAT